MSRARSERKDIVGVRRISRQYPYPRPSPPALDLSSDAASTAPVAAQACLEASSALSYTVRAPRSVLVTHSAPLELASVVRTERGLRASRADLVNSLMSKADKLECARRLVASAMNILSSAWKVVELGWLPVASASPGLAWATPRDVNSYHGVLLAPCPYDGAVYPYQSTSEHMPLRHFVHEVLRRSRTNFVTLQTALCYIEAIATRLPTLVKEEAKFALEQARVRFIPQQHDEKPEARVPPSPLLCSRRTFVVSILLASKFLQDRSYTNRSWAKLTGLAASEITRCERALCAALDYRLWVGKDSGPLPTIDELDMKPVIALSMTYQPEPAPTAPQMLRTARHETASASPTAAVDVPTLHTAEQLRLPAFKTLLESLPSAAIDESNAPVRSDAASGHLPTLLAHAPSEL